MKQQRKVLHNLAGLLLILEILILLGGCGIPMPLETPPSSAISPRSETRLTSTPEILPYFSPTPGPLAFTSATLIPPVPSIYQAYLDGNRLFFIAQDWKNTEPVQLNSVSVYMQDLTTGKTKLLSTSPYGSIGRMCCMSASPDWLTWLTNKSNGSGWLVVAKNLMTGQELILDREEDTGVKTARGPYTSISGNQFAWVSIRTMPDGVVKFYLVLTNLATGEKRTLAEATKPESLVNVDIDGDRVVWSKGSSTGGVTQSNVYLYDLASGVETQLSDDNQSHQPVINQDWIAWRQGFQDTGPIVIHNWRTGERFPLTMEGDFLRMGDGLLLWRTYRTPSAYVYDLRHHTMDSFDEHFQPPMYISGRTVVSMTSEDQEPLNNYIVTRTYLP